MFEPKFDIITFGSATQDIILESGAFKIMKDDKDFISGEGICLSLGSKINVQEIDFKTGGGGTNVAATFAKQGYKTAYCGAVGPDMAGVGIIKELKQYKIDTSLVMVKKEKHTNHSVVITSDGQDRTILAYRGAADLVCKDDIPWKKLKTKWIYLAPLTDKLCQTTEDIINFAYENGIKVAMNPSSLQLAMGEEKLRKILKKVDILFLNQEEASYVTRIPFKDEAEIFKKIDDMCPGVAVMTKGGEGVTVSDGKYIYSARPNPERQIVDATGAGDAFASGFVADFIRFNGDIEKAIQLGMANSEGNLREVGAKTGILDKTSHFKPVKVMRQLCTQNNLCLQK